MSLYYVITAENICAGKLNTNAWAGRGQDVTRKGDWRSGTTTQSEKETVEIGRTWAGRVEDGRLEKWYYHTEREGDC